MGGVALAFVYGYFGTFEGTLLNYYPIKASMILVDPTCGAEYGYTYHIFPAFITIVLTFLISMIILANKKKEPGTLTVGKKKKAVRKKVGKYQKDWTENMYHLFNNYGGKDMMYRTELLEEITIENATVKINAKIEEMEKESYRLVTMSFWGTERAVLVFKKGLKGSLL